MTLLFENLLEPDDIVQRFNARRSMHVWTTTRNVVGHTPSKSRRSTDSATDGIEIARFRARAYFGASPVELSFARLDQHRAAARPMVASPALAGQLIGHKVLKTGCRAGSVRRTMCPLICESRC